MLLYHINEKSECSQGVMEVRVHRIGVRGFAALPLAPRLRRDKSR
jgi:hypothetical protein